MAEISSVRPTRNQEIQQKQRHNDLRNLETSYHETYADTVRKNEDMLKKTKSEYESKSVNMKNELEARLGNLRLKQAEKIALEQERLDSELKDLKKAHEDKKHELSETQENDLMKMNEAQANHLEVAKKNYEKNMSKYKAT